MQKLKTSTTRSFLIIATAISLSNTQDAFAASLTSLGPGVFTPSDISADGSTVVGYRSVGSQTLAFRWTAQEGFQDIGTISSGFNYRATSVSANGSIIVGWFQDGLTTQAFKWTQNDGIQGLGYLGTNFRRSEASGISADGTVIAGWSTTNNGSTQSFRWTESAGMEGIGTLPNIYGGSSVGLNISPDGSTIVGVSPYLPVGSSLVESNSFGWNIQSGIFALGDLPGGSAGGQASSASYNGSVIVGWSGSSSGPQAYRYTAAGGLQGLGDLPGGDFASYATDVSADGNTIIGYSNSEFESFIWMPSDGMKSLAEILASQGVNTLGFNLSIATAISADGKTIIGYGSNPDGGDAWIAQLNSTPVPIPPSIWLFGSALAAFGVVGKGRTKRISAL